MVRSKEALIGTTLIISVVLSSFAALTLMQAAEASPGPTVLLDPPEIEIPYCKTGNIAICVENFTDLFGFQFKIWWLKDVVDNTGYEWRPLPPEWPELDVIKAGPDFEENATHKAVRFSINATLPNCSPFSYPGLWPFVDLDWHCIRPGVDSPLIFDRDFTKLFDIDGLEIPIEGIIDGVVINPPPPPPEMYWKENYTDYAPSGVPDFDQRQDQWNKTVPGFWSWCAPTAVANSLWWMDSRYEYSRSLPPTISDTFPLVTSYNTSIDDHDAANIVPFIAHLGYLMDTDGNRTGIFHVGTNVFDMQAGIAHYLSWTGVNPPGDVNGDGTVNQIDYNIVLAANGTTPGHPSWNMTADVWPVTLGYPNPGRADNIVDTRDLNLVETYMNSTGYFYERTVTGPEFYLVEDEVERCEDVILSIAFYRPTDDPFIDPWQRENTHYGPNTGHAVTVAGVNSTTLLIAISDPGQDNAEAGGLGRVLPPGNHSHPATPPDTIHNNARFVSHDIYKVNNTWLPPLQDQFGQPIPANFSLVNYGSPFINYGPVGTYLAVVEYAIIVSPLHPWPPRPQGELRKLIDIVEWPGSVGYVDIPFDVDTDEIEGYEEILTHLEGKGYVFDPADGTAVNVTGSVTVGRVLDEIGEVWVEEFSGTVTSWWSRNTLRDGTGACMLSAQMDDGTSMAVGFVTNLLPPEQDPGRGSIIVNAMPYIYVRFYWWAWYPIGKIVSWSYWWYDSHSHPNWFWGPYWWWRVYVRAHFQGLVYPSFPWAYWRPWWGWWWHWTYWRHWYWWSTYFPYDP